VPVAFGYGHDGRVVEKKSHTVNARTRTRHRRLERRSRRALASAHLFQQQALGGRALTMMDMEIGASVIDGLYLLAARASADANLP
jgi:hypothetical protein